MAYIEAQHRLRNHPKLSRFCRAVNMSRPEAIGTLMMLWWWCLDYAEDGQLARFKDEEIAAGAEVYVDADKFVEALCDSDLMDREERRIHDWLDYAGRYLIAKYSTSNRKKLVAIWRGYGLKYGSGYRRERIANSKRPKSERKATLPIPSLPIPNIPNHTIPNQGGMSGYVIPEPKDKPAEALIMRFKVLKGVPYEHVGWDQKWREFYRPYAEKLLRDCGSYAKAYACLEYYGELYAKKGYQDWTLRAIADRAIEWVAAQGGKQHGTANSERFFEALRKQRAMGQDNPGLRATTEAGQVLGAIRDHANAASRDDGRDQAKQANGHGRAVGSVPGPSVEGKTDRGKES